MINPSFVKWFLFLCFISSINLKAQTPITYTINGVPENYLFGAKTALSTNGNRMVVSDYGIPLNNLWGNGEMRVYDFIGGEWTQVGNTVQGQVGQAWQGHALAISGDGQLIIASHFRKIWLYRLIGNNWTKVAAFGDEYFFGNEFSVSESGDRIAVNSGYHWDSDWLVGYTGQGTVQVYDIQNDSLIPIGQKFIHNNSVYGAVKSEISGDGNRLIIGFQNEGMTAGISAGAVRVYDIQTDTLIQIGTDILPDNNYNYMGGSVSISHDGQVIAARSRSLGNSCQIKVLEQNGQDWQQVGSNIISSISNGVEYGQNLFELSPSGNKLAVHMPTYELVHLYNRSGNDWLNSGLDFQGSRFGMLDFSYHEQKLVTSLPFMAQVNIYQFQTTSNTEVDLDIGEVNLYPNPNRGDFSVNIQNPDQLGLQLQVLNPLGQIIWESFCSEINFQEDIFLSSSGMYFLQIFNDTGSQIQKVMVTR